MIPVVDNTMTKLQELVNEIQIDLNAILKSNNILEIEEMKLNDDETKLTVTVMFDDMSKLIRYYGWIEGEQNWDCYHIKGIKPRNN